MRLLVALRLSTHIAPWDETPAWEQAATTATATQIRDFLDVSNYAATRLTPEQKGRVVALRRIEQIYTHIEDPKSSYTADWEHLPERQKTTGHRDLRGSSGPPTSWPTRPHPGPIRSARAI